MSFEIEILETIQHDYKNIKGKRLNEKIVLDIMNDSRIVFPGRYESNEKQDHGESDFFDVKTNQRYDAKLLFSEAICMALSKGQTEVFYKTLHECVHVDLKNQTAEQIKQSSIFKEMERRVNSLEKDEIGILFLPYPISVKTSQPHSLGLSDVFDICFQAMNYNKPLYLITENIINQIEIRALGRYKNEFLQNRYFNNLVNATVTKVIGNDTI